MKTTHSEKRQQVWLEAYAAAIIVDKNPSLIAEMTLSDFDKKFPEPAKKSKSRKMTAAAKLFLESHNVLLKIRNHIAPNTPLNNELFVEVKNNLEDLKDYISFLRKIKVLFPGITDEQLLTVIKNNKESHDRLDFIKNFYDITWSDEYVVVLPKISQPVRIIPERDTFHDVPPEYPNGDKLTPIYDSKICMEQCSPNCSDCGYETPGRTTPDRDTNTYLDKI